MTARGRTTIKLADFKGTKRDEGAIDIETEDGTVFTIDPPVLWPDEVIALTRSGDTLGLAVAVLGGQERYDQFLAAGGSAAILDTIIGEVHGTPAGESAASSRS